MELRCLPNFQKRLTLWRNTISLFGGYSRFPAPFKKAGLSQFRVESPINKKTGEERTPDIIAWNAENWVAIDLTFNDDSKASQLDGYKDLDPQGLHVYSTTKVPTDISPDTISSRLKFNNDGDHCQIVVQDILDVKEERFIRNKKLRDELVKAKGQSMKKLPAIPFTIVPEMNHPEELRAGLVEAVKQLFAPGSEGKTAYEICKICLERLFEHLPANQIKSLTTRIDRELKLLTGKQYLKGYLEYKNGKYCAVERYKNPQFQTRKFIESKIKEWISSSQQPLKV